MTRGVARLATYIDLTERWQRTSESIDWVVAEDVAMPASSAID